MSHGFKSPLYRNIFKQKENKKSARRVGGHRTCRSLSIDFTPPDLAPFASAQVAGLHRAVPSTTLDKAIEFSYEVITSVYFTTFWDKVKRGH
jgi:hypothetical protein